MNGLGDIAGYDPAEERGTVRWFGPAWGAWICRPHNEVPVPVGTPCGGHDCIRDIEAGERGITIPFSVRRGSEPPPGTYWQPRPGWWVHAYHIRCFMGEVLDLKS